MKRRRLKIAIAFILPALLLAGCAGMEDSQEDGPVTLTVMGRKSDLAKSYMTCIFERYESATGNHIEPIPFEDAEFETTAQQRFAQGDVPDIFLHFHNSDLDRFDVEGNFLYLDDQPWVDELTESTLAYCLNGDGKLMGLPYWENSVSGCYYNKTILDGLGLRPATTQSEFDVLCEALVESGHVPICWPADGCAWMVQFALDPVFADDPEKLRAINRNELSYAEIPEVAAMTEWIRDAAERGWFGSDYLNLGIDDIGPTMSAGEAVMTFIWDTWFYTDLPEDGAYTVDDFALMPVFLNTVNGGTYEGGNLNMMMVNKNGAHVDDCLDFLSFCATAENYNAAFDGISTVNCFKGQTTNIQSPMVTDAAESIAENLRASTSASRVKGYSNDDIVPALNELFRGRIDVEECVRRMDDARIAAAAKQGVEGFTDGA